MSDLQVFVRALLATTMNWHAAGPELRRIRGDSVALSYSDMK
jgi:hypothetical protein